MTSAPEVAEREAGLARCDVRVVAADTIASGVRMLRLESLDSSPLPPWTPGAHLDVLLPDGLIRQYSLCGDPAVLSHYLVAVLLEPDSRGGSRQLHGPGVAGTVLGLRGPRNHFALEPATSYLFIAGGIGITPLLPMIRTADAAGVPWRLLYGGRRRASMAFVAEVAAIGCSSHGTVEIVPQDERGVPDLASAVAQAADDALIYCCGPDGLLRAVEDLCAGESGRRLRVERFAATASQSNPTPVEQGANQDTAFQVELRRSGLVLDVPADRTLLQVVEEALPDVMYSCEEGYCGTCEAVVLDGEPEHRDTALSDAERADSATMMICVSRSVGPRLVLDL